MFNRSKHFWYNLIFLFAIIISLILVIIIMKHTHTKPKVNNLTYDAFMTGLIYDSYDNQGQLQSHVITSKMTHYGSQNAVYLIAPHIHYYSANHAPWKIHALYGVNKQNDGILHLWGNVKMHELASANEPETTILTNAISINTKNSTATTNDKVTLIRPGTKIKGKGLRANFKKGVFQLLSHSEGFYSPKEKKSSQLARTIRYSSEKK